VHSTKVGAVVGVIAATSMIYVVSLMGWAEKATWVPFVFLAIAMLGFFTWEFGFIGIQRKNNRFARFEKALKRGKHIFFVDIESENESILSKILKKHPKLKRAGDGPSVPQWFVSLQERFGLFNRSV
ncbi:NAD/FAD-utilizing enzyme, partial [Porticoccaceae bacterium]|nr:NAD/FAD-utilizing enzyme [Porticoccaceae bacterium]